MHGHPNAEVQFSRQRDQLREKTATRGLQRDRDFENPIQQSRMQRCP
jgi:hypothetical protein